MKIIVSAGGTGGHIYPALAIIEKFKEKEKELEVLYIGTHNRMEKDIIPNKGYKYIGLEIYGLSKNNMLRNIKNIYLIKKAKKECIKIMKNFKPDIVIGAGGYITYPVLQAAKKLKIKTFIHEQNSIPGKSNRVLSKDINLVGVSFKNSEVYFKSAKKVFYSGNPCSSTALTAKDVDKKSLGLTDNKKLILIVGGSLGSSTLNEKFKAFLNLVGEEKYEVLFITGKAHYNNFIENTNFPSNVKVLPYYENLPGLMKKTDLIISRAGASTISEILALKVPSILIPSPYVANNHQYFNALDLSNMGVSNIIEEKKLTTEKLFIAIEDLVGKNNNIEKLIKNLDKYEDIDSAELIYNNIKEVLK